MGKLRYACNRDKLDPELRRVFFLSEKSPQTSLFLEQKTPWYQIKFMIFVLMHVIGLSHYNIMGILGYQTFLLDEDFVRKYITKKKNKTLLDIGAWNGSITAAFAPYTAEITCIELSLSFQKILKKRGYTVLKNHDEKLYDMVTIFNVLDVCADPQNIIEQAMKNLEENGTLIISLPFPIWTRSWDMSNIRRTNHLGQPREKSFEMGVSEFYDSFLRKNKLTITGFTRIPYLVSNPESRHITIYDNGFFICKKTSN